MSVTKEIIRLDKSNVKMNITVPKDDVRAKYEEILNEFLKNLQLPGFRKGKVPKEVLERKYTGLKSDVKNHIIESSWKDAFNENISRYERPISNPELQEEPELDLDQDFHFSLIYDVWPEFKVNQWKGLTAEYPYAEVTEEDINRELDEIRERNAFIMDRDDDAAAQKGDVATVNYQIFNENGEEEADLKRDDFVFTIGSGSYYRFDDDIAGMKKGETKEFEKKYDNSIDHELAGKTKKIRVTLTALKEKKLPDLDDELAQDIDEKYNTLDDLKNNIRERLNKNLEKRLRVKKINSLLKKITENTPVVIPESLIREEIESYWRRLASLYNMTVDSLKQLMDNSELNKEEREQEQRNIAVKTLHSRMIIDSLIEEQNIEVSGDDVEKELELIAAEENITVEDLKKDFDEKHIFYLKEGIKEQRINDILIAENDLKPGKKENYLDFMTDNS